MSKKMSKKLVIKNVRLSWFDVFKPQEVRQLPNGDSVGGKFRASLLMGKGDKQIEAVKELCKEAIEAKWGTKPPKIKREKYPFKDGDESDHSREEGNWVLTTSEWPENKPLVVGRKNEVLTEESGTLYQGCYVNAIVTAYAYDSKMSKGVSLNIKAVQFVRDGDPLGATTISIEDAFEPLEDEDETTEDDLFGDM